METQSKKHPEISLSSATIWPTLVEVLRHDHKDDKNKITDKTILNNWYFIIKQNNKYT